MPINPKTGQLTNGTTNNPMTGQRYGAAPIDPMTGQMIPSDQPNTGGPIGGTVQNKKSNESRFLHDLMGGGAFVTAINYRSQRALIAQGPTRNPLLRKFKMSNMMDKSLHSSIHTGGVIRSGWEETKRDQLTRFNPFNWRKAPSMMAFDPNTAKKEYQASNWVLKHTGISKTAFAQKTGMVDAKGEMRHLIDPHFLSRMSAAGSFDKAAKKKRLGNRELTKAERRDLGEYLSHSNNDLYKRMLFTGELDDGSLTLRDAGAITRMGMSNALTGRMSAFSQGILNPGAIEEGSSLLHTPFASAYNKGEAYGELGDVFKSEGMAGLRNIAGKKADQLMFEGLGRGAAEKFAGKGAMELMAKTGLKIGADIGAQFIPGVDVALDVYLAYSLAKGAFSLAGKLVTGTASAAAQSFVGGAFKPQFGGGYHDTLAASTSRSRGVQAIQNSRLNARSVLGNEAGSIHQHFS